MNCAVVTIDKVVSLRVDFIGWVDAPKNYVKTLFVSDSDFDWTTLSLTSCFRISLSDDLHVVEAAQKALGVMLSNGNLATSPKFKDIDGNWVDSVDPLVFGNVHEVRDVYSAESLLYSVFKIAESESTFCLPRNSVKKEMHKTYPRQSGCFPGEKRVKSVQSKRAAASASDSILAYSNCKEYSNCKKDYTLQALACAELVLDSTLLCSGLPTVRTEKVVTQLASGSQLEVPPQVWQE